MTMRPPRTSTQHPGVVSRDWSKTAPALITLDSGVVFEAVGGDEMHDLMVEGQEAVVYLDQSGRMLGWMLVHGNVGVNFANDPRDPPR